MINARQKNASLSFRSNVFIKLEGRIKRKLSPTKQQNSISFKKSQTIADKWFKKLKKTHFLPSFTTPKNLALETKAQKINYFKTLIGLSQTISPIYFKIITFS